MNENKQNIANVGKVILQYILVSFSVSYAFYMFGGSTDNFWGNMLSYALITLSFVIVYLLNLKNGNYAPKELVASKTKEDWRIYLMAAVLGIALAFLYSPMGTLIEEGLLAIGFKAESGVQLEMNNIWEMFGCLIFVALLPAVFEEVMLRGIIYDNLKKIKPVVRIILTSLIFMLLHANIFQTVYQFLILGLILTIVVHLTKNLKLSMLMHFLNNAVVIIYTFIVSQVNKGAETAETTIDAPFVLLAVGLFILAILLSVGFLLLTKKIRKYKEEEKPEDVKTVKKKKPEVKYENPTDWFWFSFGMFVAIGFWVLSLIIG